MQEWEGRRESRQVVGAAIVRGGRVLAARRSAPAATAGRWEFPGGKVEPGESPDDALVREVQEELGCTIEVTGWLEGEVPLGTAYVLRVAVVRLVAGDPDPVEHDEVRWLLAEELHSVDWLEGDRPFLAGLPALLAAEPGRQQGGRQQGGQQQGSRQLGGWTP